MEFCLQVKDLHLNINSNKIVKELSFDLPFGKTLAIVGESGAGKSMIAQTIIQCLPESAKLNKASSIKLAGQELIGLSEAEMCLIRGKDIGLIFQDAMAALNPVQTIGQQLIEGQILHKINNKANSKQSILDLLTAVGINNPKLCFDSYPHQLSGGMLQRALIAAVLSTKPKLLIADEPTTALDVTVQAKLMQLLANIKKEYSCGLIFISHDLLLVKDIADYILVMQSGQCVEYAKAKDFFHAPLAEYSKLLLAAAMPSDELQTTKLSDKILAVNNLSVRFKQTKTMKKTEWFYAVNNASFNLHAGTTLALIGESGSGKTTLAKALLGIVEPLGVLDWSEAIKPKSDIAVVFQSPFASMNPRMRVIDILSELWRANPKLTPENSQEVLIKALEEVGLSASDLSKYPHQFSGGERQRLCIARAIVGQPKLIILDEPTSALDVSIQVAISDLLLELQQKYNYTYLLITHDFVVVKKMAHYVAVMQQGEIMEQGNIEQVFYQPKTDYTKDLLAAIPGAAAL